VWQTNPEIGEIFVKNFEVIVKNIIVELGSFFIRAKNGIEDRLEESLVGKAVQTTLLPAHSLRDLSVRTV